MAATRMTHPEHGYHIAYNGAEELVMEKSGWKKITDADFKALVAAKSAKPEEATEEAEDAPVVKKAGRPKKV